MADNNIANRPEQRHGAGTYQMLWDCRFCGTKKLLGVTHRHCPNCGAAQDPEWRYFPAEEDMVALADHKYVGADKVCPACGQPNSAASTYCSECGADLATGETVQMQGERVIGTGIAESDTRHDVVQERFQAEMERVGAASSGGRGFLGLGKTGWIIAGVALLVALIAFVIFAVTYRKDVTGQIERMTWERVIDVQDFQPRSDGSWQDSMPGDAYGQRCYEKQRGTRKVESGSHQECKDVDQGDGSFKRECQTVKDYRDEPVYDTWCDYTIDRWANARSVRASGDSEQPAPTWPALTLASGTGRYGQEREGAKHESYAVEIRDSGGELRTCAYNTLDEWAPWDVGMNVALKVGLLGNPDCDTLKRSD